MLGLSSKILLCSLKTMLTQCPQIIIMTLCVESLNMATNIESVWVFLFPESLQWTALEDYMMKLHYCNFYAHGYFYFARIMLQGPIMWNYAGINLRRMKMYYKSIHYLASDFRQFVCISPHQSLQERQLHCVSPPSDWSHVFCSIPILWHLLDTWLGGWLPVKP